MAGILFAVTVPLFYLLSNSFQLYKNNYAVTSLEIKGMQLIDRLLENYHTLPFSSPESIQTDHAFFLQEILVNNTLELDKEALQEFRSILNKSSFTNKQHLSENYFFPLARSITNRSNLILDPNLDTYYLMDITSSRVPRILLALSNDSNFISVDNLLNRLMEEVQEIQYSLETARRVSVRNRTTEDFSSIIDRLTILEKEIANQKNGNKRFDLKTLSTNTYQLSAEASTLLKHRLTERNENLEKESLFVLSVTLLFWLTGIIALVYLISQFLNAQKTAFDKILRQKRSLDSSTLILEFDLSGNILYANSLMAAVSGYSTKELEGKNLKIFNAGLHKKPFWMKFRKTTRAGLIWKGEICNKAKDGTIFWTETVVIPDLDKDEKVIGFSAVGVDITEKKADHLKLEHSLKLASIGEIAAKVGHEINNPLAISVGSSCLMRKELLTDNFSKEKVLISLQKIESANERIKKIVNGLRTYSRTDDSELVPLSVKETVQQTIQLIEEIYTQEGIHLKVQLPEDDVFINGNLGKLQQVLMNLISNARDALNGHTEKRISLEVMHTNGKVTLSVEDNGDGIPEEIRNKIFHPFFTTKAPGKGTGIGLGVVDEFVKFMNGTVEVSSTPSVGTKFTIAFQEYSFPTKKSA